MKRTNGYIVVYSTYMSNNYVSYDYLASFSITFQLYQDGQLSFFSPRRLRSSISMNITESYDESDSQPLWGQARDSLTCIPVYRCKSVYQTVMATCPTVHFKIHNKIYKNYLKFYLLFIIVRLLKLSPLFVLMYFNMSFSVNNGESPRNFRACKKGFL